MEGLRSRILPPSLDGLRGSLARGPNVGPCHVCKRLCIYWACRWCHIEWIKRATSSPTTPPSPSSTGDYSIRNPDLWKVGRFFEAERSVNIKIWIDSRHLLRVLAKQRDNHSLTIYLVKVSHSYSGRLTELSHHFNWWLVVALLCKNAYKGARVRHETYCCHPLPDCHDAMSTDYQGELGIPNGQPMSIS